MSGNRMFFLFATMVLQTATCFQTMSENESHLWHCCFGHLSYKGLMTFSYKKLVNVLHTLKAPKKLCADCLAGKQHKDSMPK